MSYDPQKPDEQKQSIFAVIVHSFFVVPFLLAIFCVLLFTAVRILTMEQHSPQDYLEDIKTGGLTKRWQAAFELSRLLADKKQIPEDQNFIEDLAKAYEHAETDDPRVKQYLAFAIGRTGNTYFTPVLLKNITQEKDENLYAIIASLGILKDKTAVESLVPFLNNNNPRIRLATVIALGQIGDATAIEPLKTMLNDVEPNITWDAAIALAKIGNKEAKGIILNLLDREYLNKFPEVNNEEQSKILMVTIQAIASWNDEDINHQLKKIFDSDKNMNVRKLANEALTKNNP